MSQKDIDKVHVGVIKISGRYTLSGHKNVVKAYVNLQYYKYIDGNDCIKDYFITKLQGYINKLSIISISFLYLFLI